MKSTDLREDYKAKIKAAVESGDIEAMTDVVYEMAQKSNSEEQIQELREELDRRILAQRGKKQLTSYEQSYYEEVIEAMRSRDPQQAIANIDKTFPETVVNEVFEELRTNHPLLSKIDFVNSTGNDKLLYDSTEADSATWGELCDTISKELSLSLKVVQTGLYKLSAFIYACKPGMELGAAWLDAYVREHLYEALASGLVSAIIKGDGNDKPIGMNRNLNGAVVAGAYPAKTAIEITNFDIDTVGNLISLVAYNNGKPRKTDNLILVVNDADYYHKVMPATMLMAPDGSYRSILPYPIEIIKESSVPSGYAIFGIANRYFASAGIPKDGRIEFSDEYKFLEDKRTYLIKTYANGMPKDNSAFLYLDISDVVPATYKVTAIDNREPSTDATLSDLRLGSLTLSPTFAAGTTSYTASTTNATTIITATPNEANQSILILNGTTYVENGTAATWASGSNTLTVTVTAEDGETTKTYTVTVTKS